MVFGFWFVIYYRLELSVVRVWMIPKFWKIKRRCLPKHHSVSLPMLFSRALSLVFPVFCSQGVFIGTSWPSRCHWIKAVFCQTSRHGRKHNIMPGNVNFRANLWALREAGCTHVLASNACGGLQEYTRPGDLVVLDDFFDRTQGRKQTFYDGEPCHPVGVVHLPCADIYCERTRQVKLLIWHRCTEVDFNLCNGACVLVGHDQSSKKIHAKHLLSGTSS